MKDLSINQNTKSSKFFRIINEIPTILLVIIIFIVIYKPTLGLKNKIKIYILNLSKGNFPIMNIQELKEKSSEQLIDEAEKLGIENASTLRRQEIYFAILKKTSRKRRRNNWQLAFFNYYKMVLVFLRAMESNYLPGADDIYISPSQIRRFGLRTGDTVEGTN